VALNLLILDQLVLLIKNNLLTFNQDIIVHQKLY